MSRFTSSLAAALVAVVLAAPSFAAAPAKAKTQSIVGTLQKVDGQNLTIQTSKGSETVMLAPKAQIRNGSKVMTAADLSSHTGDRVKVRYTESGGKKEASSVAVSAAKPVQTASAKSVTPKSGTTTKK
jgi:hypothetical protein